MKFLTLSSPRLYLFLFSLISWLLISNFLSASVPGLLKRNTLVLATYVSDHEQERKATVLIRSLRHNGGSYKDCPVYVVVSDSEQYACSEIRNLGVTYLHVSAEQNILDYPFAYKAFAAARVETLVMDEATTLVWFDPETIVLGDLKDLDLKKNKTVALRPVFLSNSIGINEKDTLNDYWSRVFNETHVSLNDVPMVTTVVDQKKIRAYYNCGIFSVNPRLGIFREWAHVFSTLLNDTGYQQKVCNTSLRRIFLHQIIVTAVILSSVSQKQIQWLPMTCGYSFHLHDRMPKQNKQEHLNAVTCAIVEDVWNQNPSWMDAFTVDEPLKSWLEDTFIEFLNVAPHIYRVEGSCNSYLVTTGDGSVLIDPAGANDAPQWFRKIIALHPLRAVLFTHAHNDHVVKSDQWIQGRNIPVIAQRNHADLVRYHDELSGFFSRRNAIWSRRPFMKDTAAYTETPVFANRFFADTMTYSLGGYRFIMTHTPGETPDHATIWIPELSAVFAGDNYYEYFINNSTFRGTTVRPVSGYIAALDKALSLKPEFFFMGHGAPVIGHKAVQFVVGDFRDALKYIYKETVRGINEGKDVYTLMNEVRLPARYQARPYYGKVEWTVRGLYHELTGWFDENPASMYDLPVSGIYNDLVELSGGADSMLIRAQELFNGKEYVKVLHLTDIILHAEPNHVQTLAIRKKALQALKKRNFIENIWLDYGIRQIDETLK